MGDEAPEELALERGTGHLVGLSLWESEAACDGGLVGSPREGALGGSPSGRADCPTVREPLAHSRPRPTVLRSEDRCPGGDTVEAWEKASGPFRALTAELKDLSESLPYVDAFWIQGSRASGHHRRDSDMDYMFLVRRRIDMDHLARRIRRFLDFEEIPAWFPEDTWIVGYWKQARFGLPSFVSPHIEVTRSAFQRARNLFNMRPIRVRYVRWRAPIETTYFLHHQGFGYELLEETVPVYDPRATLERLQALVSAYPDSLARQLVQDFVSRLRIKLRWHTDRWTPRGKPNFLLAIQDILYYIAAAHYAKNRRLMRPLGLTRYHFDLATLKPDLRRDLDRFLAIDDRFGRDNKGAHLRRIADRLARPPTPIRSAGP